MVFLVVKISNFFLVGKNEIFDLKSTNKLLICLFSMKFMPISGRIRIRKSGTALLLMLKKGGGHYTKFFPQSYSVIKRYLELRYPGEICTQDTSWKVLGYVFLVFRNLTSDLLFWPPNLQFRRFFLFLSLYAYWLNFFWLP